jgi:predicted ATPase/transcriptional regulator with XRE-family HTH domain
MSVRDSNSFGELVRQYRRALGLTQEALAERAGVSPRGVRALEAGERRAPQRETVRLLADALELGEDERLEFEATARMPDSSDPDAFAEQRVKTAKDDISDLSAPPAERASERGHIETVLERKPVAELPAAEQDRQLPPNNLPEEPARFIGREREIGHLAELLRDPYIRLVTLTGPGGTGKTRLALELATTILHDFKDGVFFVNLAPLADPALVSSAVAEALEIKEESGKDLEDSLAGALREKHLLLVLDNFEHLLAGTAVVARLLEDCRAVHVLATSRTPLNLRREHMHAVPPLAVPDPTNLPGLGVLTQYEAVALFIERARAASDSFGLTTENAPAVAAICVRLDGLPLAIELAAARIKLFPPRALLQRLSSRLDLLTGGAKDTPSRQQTLRNTLDWSYALLTNEEQRLFAGLSVFAGGCTFEAAEAVCNPEGGYDLLEGMASLVDKSLLRQEGEREPRFVMLETIREYAAERLVENGASDSLNEEHTRHYLALAEGAASRLEGQEQAPWLELLEVERDNLRAALQSARDQGDLDRGLRLALALRRFWMVRGPVTEGRRWLEDLADRDEGSPLLQAIAIFTAGELAAAEGRRRVSAELFERSLVLYRELGNRRGHAQAVGHLAATWHQAGEMERALDLVHRSEIEGRQIGDDGLLAVSLRLQTGWAASQADMKKVQDLGEESLTLYRRLDDAEGIANVLRILAYAAYSAGDRQRARSLTDDLLDLLRRLPLDAENGEWLERLAYRARVIGDYSYARHLLGELAARAEAVGDRRIAARARGGLGLLAREQGDYLRATALYRESLAEFEEVEDPLGRCRALLGLSDIARDKGDVERLVELCEESLALLREIGDAAFTGFALHNLGMAAWYEGDGSRAERFFAESLSLMRRQQNVVDTVEVLASVGQLALDSGQYDRAADTFAECLVTARKSESRWIMGTILEGMAGVAAARREPERAARLFGVADAIRTRMGVRVRPTDRAFYEHNVRALRNELGEERFAAAWNDGQSMSLEDAVAYALDESAEVPRDPAPRATRAAGSVQE